VLLLSEPVCLAVVVLEVELVLLMGGDGGGGGVSGRSRRVAAVRELVRRRRLDALPSDGNRAGQEAGSGGRRRGFDEPRRGCAQLHVRKRRRPA
jgi:hypothetical protein